LGDNEDEKVDKGNDGKDKVGNSAVSTLIFCGESEKLIER
jgi:hypothetical protein